MAQDNYVGGNLADSINTAMNEASAPLTSVRDTNTISKNLMYPANLSDPEAGFTSYLSLRAYSLSSTTRDFYGKLRQSNATESGKSSAEGNILLPMPIINQTQGASYSASGNNVASEAIKTAGSVIGADGLSSQINALTQGVKAITGTAFGQVAQGVAGASNAGVLAANSTVLSDTSVTAFNGIELRQITLLWTFAPASLPELKVVGDIVDQLHLWALPTTVRGKGESELKRDAAREGFRRRVQFYKTPPVIMLNEQNISGSERYITPFVMGPTGISNVRLNRHPNQYEATFKTGDPAVIEVEVTFNELLPQTAEIYLNDRQNKTV